VGGDPQAADHDPADRDRPRARARRGGRWIREVVDEVLDAAGVEVTYRIGTMIETPRAALLADRWPSTPSSSPSAPTT
jgi:hypothetical protein